MKKRKNNVHTSWQKYNVKMSKNVKSYFKGNFMKCNHKQGCNEKTKTRFALHGESLNEECQKMSNDIFYYVRKYIIIIFSYNPQ